MTSSATSFVTYGGEDISDMHRTMTYLRNMADGMGECAVNINGTCGCPLDAILTFSTPAADYANGQPPSWYDPMIPESGEFLGVILSNPVIGLDRSPLSRSITPLASAGGTLGRLRLGPREIVFNGVLYATTECGMRYGEQWLTQVLKAENCYAHCNPQDCYVDELQIRQCCPEKPTSAFTGLHSLFNVGLLDAPTFTRAYDSDICCDLIVATSWTMAAEMPWIFEGIHTVMNQLLLAGSGTCFHWCADCPADDLTPCDTLTAIDDVYCEPIWRTDAVTATIPPQPQFRDAVGIVTISSGSAALERAVVKFYEQSCGSIDECDEPCNVIEVFGLPADVSLTVDARTRVVTLFCADGSSVPGDPYVRGRYGPVSWPQFGCFGGCVTAYAAIETLAADASVFVQYAPRWGG